MMRSIAMMVATGVAIASAPASAASSGQPVDILGITIGKTRCDDVGRLAGWGPIHLSKGNKAKTSEFKSPEEYLRGATSIQAVCGPAGVVDAVSVFGALPDAETFKALLSSLDARYPAIGPEHIEGQFRKAWTSKPAAVILAIEESGASTGQFSLAFVDVAFNPGIKNFFK